MKIGVGASKILSLFIVWGMVCSAFAGIMVMIPGAGQAQSPSEVDGDIYIGEDFTISRWEIGGTVNLNGDLVIRAGGVVNVTNGLLKFRSWDGNINQLIIEDGGRLNLINSAMEAELVLYNVSYSLGVLVRNGGVLYAEDSRLDFNGKVLVDDAALIAHRTTISGPLFTAMSSQVELYDSELIDTPGFPMLEELTYPYPFASAANQTVGVTYLFERNPSESPTHDVSLVQMNDSAKVTLAQNDQLETTGFDIGGLVFNAGDAVSMVLKAEYKTADDFVAGTPDTFYYARYLDTPVAATSMQVVETYDPYNPAATNTEKVLSQDITGLGLSSIDLSMLSVRLTNTKAQNVTIDRIWVEVGLTIQAYHNITIAGTSELTAVNSKIGANYLAQSDYNFRKLVVTDAAQANLYGVEVDGTFIENGTGPFVTISKTISFRPSLIDGATTNVYGILVDDGYAIPTRYVTIAGGGTFKNITGFLTGELNGDVSDLQLLVKWRTDVGFAISQPVMYSVNYQPVMYAGITISLADSEATQIGSLDNYAPTTINEISELNIHFTNTNIAGTDTDAQIGYVELIASINPSINLYRWIDIKVVDSNNLPVSGAQVNATRSISGDPSIYLYNNTVNLIPPQGVLDYLGRNSSSISVTNDSGMVLLPLLTDIINQNWEPNSYVIENYRISVDYVNTTNYHFIPEPQYTTFDGYPNLGVQSINMEFVLANLQLELPDIKAVNFYTDPTIIYRDDTVTLHFQVVNVGVTTASQFSVEVKDSIGNVTNTLGKINLTNVLAGEYRNVSIVWLSNYTTPGVHSIIINVDAGKAVLESDEINNILTVQVEVLDFLPDLEITETSIWFSQNPGFAKQPMNINVNISNVAGKLVALNANVSFYVGNPLSGGVLQGNTSVEVAPGGVTAVSFVWTPVQIGTYPIYVTVNEAVGGARPINEYRYDNNMASRVLAVILVADTKDLLVTDVVPAIIGASLSWQNNIIIEDDGYLALVNTQLYMNQVPTNRPTQIVVRDNGVLVLDSTTISSNPNLILRIYLFDNARLYLNSSTLSSNVVLILDDDSMAYMMESKVQGDLQAPASSSAELVAYNTTFGSAWSYFGGMATADLTGVSINGVPALSPKDGAVITLYSWIVASVYDGTGKHKIPGAYVEARSFKDQNVYATGRTNDTGDWMFRALSDVVTSAGQGSVVSGYYQLNATHWYAGERYDSDLNKIAQVPYNPDIVLVRTDALVRLDISSALPDIDPPFMVSNNEPLRGSDVILSTVINNIGVVTAYNILIRFEDTSSAGKVLIKDHVIDALPAASNVTVTVTWMATYPLGVHNLSVTVDPLDQIPELNEDNNFNYTEVNVLGVPDLLVIGADISITPSSPVRDKSSSISVNVRNIGDNAIAAFNVSFYDDGLLINKSKISNLPNGQVAIASISWVPSYAGVHTVSVIVDEENEIVESDYANNQASRSVIVLDYPDLLASTVRFSVNGQAVSSVFVNTVVTITVDIYNIGESTADQFSVVFWLNDEEIIDIVQATNMPAGTMASLSTTWVAKIVEGQGLYQDNTITAWVNPPSNSTITHYPEMDDPENGNNIASQVLEVVDNRPDMAAMNGRVQFNGLNVTSATIGQRVFVLFDLENVGIIDGTGINVRVSLVNDTMDMLLFSQTVNVKAGVSAPYNVSYVVNVTSGSYTFVVDVDAGADADPSDNMLEIGLSVVKPDPTIVIYLGNKFDYAPGASIFVQGTVTQKGTNAPLGGQTVKVKIVDSQGFALTSEYTATTNANGQFTTWVLVPSGQEGTQRLLVTVDTIEGEYSNDVEINIVAPFAPETIPLWVYLLIVAIVIAVIVIFSLYLYRVGLGRMVECGNCGALIPEASRHCPKCGVEFESDTAKCSECGAWIPAKAESCPDCGAKFLTEPVEVGQAPGYIESMRKQYDEYIDGFRGQAKAALGSKYSEEKFMEWLQTEPNYLPFEEWLRKEETSRKSGVFPCPACGTLNPRDSKICNRCGTVFEQQVKTETPKAEEKKSPFRRIVRRSSEPKKEEKEAPKEEPKTEEGDKPI